jgi:hypothetical protein
VVIFRSVLFFALMPNIGLGALPSDTQPFAFLLACVGFMQMVQVNGSRASVIAVPFIVMAFLASLSAAVAYVLQVHSSVDLLRYYYGYISAPIIVGYLVFKLPSVANGVVVKVVDAVLVVTALGMVLQLVGLASIINVLVNRSVYVDVTESARGFTSFYSEQSRVSIHLGIVAMIYLLEGSLTGKRIVVIASLSFLSFAGQVGVVLSQLTLAALASIVLYALWHLSAKKKHLMVAAAASLSLITLVLAAEPVMAVLASGGLPTHGFNRALRVMELGGSYIANDAGIIVKLSGLFQAVSSLWERPIAFALGAPATEGYAESISATYANLSMFFMGHARLAFPDRLYSAFGTWVVDFGVIGVLSMVTVHALILQRIFRGGRRVQIATLLAYVFWSMVTILQVALANPALWALLALLWTRAGDDRAPEPDFPTTAR